MQEETANGTLIEFPKTEMNIVEGQISSALNGKENLGQAPTNSGNVCIIKRKRKSKRLLLQHSLLQALLLNSLLDTVKIISIFCSLFFVYAIYIYEL